MYGLTMEPPCTPNSRKPARCAMAAHPATVMLVPLPSSTGMARVALSA